MNNAIDQANLRPWRLLMVVGTFVCLLAIGIWLIFRPHTDDAIAARFDRMHLKYQRSSRTPLLVLCMDAPSLFNYGGIWVVTIFDEVTSEELECLAQLKELTDLTFVNCKTIDREKIHLLGDLPAVERLMIINSPITDDDVQHIARIPRLRHLSFHQCEISDVGLMQLADAERLNHLNLGGTMTTPEGRAELQRRKPRLTIYVADK